MTYITERCPHIAADSLQSLVLGEASPSLAACDRCTHLDFLGSPRGFDALRELSIMGVSPGQTLLQAVALMGDSRFTLFTDPTHDGLRVLLYDGKPVETIFSLRRTAEGAALFFQGDSQPWWQRIIHPDHLGWGLGIRTEQPVTDQLTVWTQMQQSLRRGGLRMRANHVLRFR